MQKNEKSFGGQGKEILPDLKGKTLPKPRAIQGFTIDRETLEHLSPLHRTVAEIAIKTGRWYLV